MGVGPTVKRILKEYKGQVRLVIKHFPYKYRDFSFIAAEAALAARDQGKFWQMHWLLHERSPKLDRNSLIQYAKEIGLNVWKFKKDLDTMKHKKEIDRDLELTRKMGLYNTPTFFINGLKVMGNRPFENFKKIIDKELQRKQKRE